MPAVTSWLNAGGFVIGGCDAPGFDAVCRAAGHTPNSHSTTTITLTNPLNTNPLSCDGNTGTFRNLNLLTAGGAQSYWIGGTPLVGYTDGPSNTITDSISSPSFVLTGDIN